MCPRHWLSLNFQVLVKPKGNTVLFSFRSNLTQLGHFRSCTHLLQVVVPILILFSKPTLYCYLDLFIMCIFQWPLWDLCSGLLHIQLAKSLVCCLRSYLCICSSELSQGVHIQLYEIAFLSSLVSVISLTPSVSLNPLPLLPCQPTSQKMRPLISSLSCVLPSATFASRAKCGRQRKNNKHLIHDHGTVAPLMKKNDFPTSCFYNPLWYSWGWG